MQSQGALGAPAEPGVDADEDSKRRQREELMYWNAIRLEKLKKNDEQQERPVATRSRGSSFEDFLQEEHGAEKGTTYVLHNTSTDVGNDEGLRQRGGARGLASGSAWANPFGDEHNIELSQESGIVDATDKYEILSQGLYSANDSPRPAQSTLFQPQDANSRETTATLEQLIDTSDPPISLPDTEEHSAWGQEPLSRTRNIPIHSPIPAEAESAFASIHAWADQTNASFYSPLPTTPRALSPTSNPSTQPLHVSIPTLPQQEEFDDPPESVPGDLTPTDSMSIVGASEADVDVDVWGPRSGATSENGRGNWTGDVLSVADSEDSDVESQADGVHTPSSWSEVASVVSEGDVIAH